MPTTYRYKFDEDLLSECMRQAHWNEAFEALAEPLHIALNQAQTFEFLDELSPLERLIISFDYVQAQIGQGGFIQLIQNGYVSLLATVIESLQALQHDDELISILDDALKIFVLNKEQLDREMSVEEFGRLYGAFKEFEKLEEEFARYQPTLVRKIVVWVAG